MGVWSFFEFLRVLSLLSIGLQQKKTPKKGVLLLFGFLLQFQNSKKV